MEISDDVRTQFKQSRGMSLWMPGLRSLTEIVKWGNFGCFSGISGDFWFAGSSKQFRGEKRMVNEKQSRVDQLQMDIWMIDQEIDRMKQKATDLRAKQAELQELLDDLAAQSVYPSTGMTKPELSTETTE